MSSSLPAEAPSAPGGAEAIVLPPAFTEEMVRAGSLAIAAILRDKAQAALRVDVWLTVEGFELEGRAMFIRGVVAALEAQPPKV